MDDSKDDSLQEIEAFLSGEEKPAKPQEASPGFDEMLKSALDSATTAAPQVEDNDAWLDAILAETEEESSAAVSAMYGSAEAAQANVDAAMAGTGKPEQTQSTLKRQGGGPGAPRAKQRAPQEGEESLEDAVAAALRSAAMPAVGGSLGEKKRPAPPQRGGGLGPSTRRMMPPPPAPARVPEPVEELDEEPVPRRSAEAEETAKVKELREQVQQFGRETEKYRERMEEQAKQARDKGRKDVFDRLLPILDTLDIAIQSAPSAKSADKVIAGVEMVYSQLLTELSRLGLECINPVGETFDPALHEAMQRSQTGEVEAGQINKVLRRGFLLNGKLVRAAQVVVEA